MNHIRSAYPSEAQCLTELAFRSKALWGYTSDFMDTCRDELSHTPAQIEDKESVYNVVEIGGKLAGFYKLEQFQQPKILLEALFVEPCYIGQGIGRALFEHAKHSASRLGGLALEVQSDPNAQEFYQHVGMTVIGQQQSASIAGRFLPTLAMPLTNQL
ncbi:GNAT family N-acetyltransferase [Aliiglaciecola sp. LCG003]|uniref:GNAT family N-acetyltransferase n=1 Tax=Aliiglaciecola sp. LCG003 TaxID=3053655 RepID=UPI00257478F8|nr:GNAT family N-acetyltransferase [Aliiglaciecola sp. LCG003]WJG10053.1 GNAT family N-acetyltransferase [Aliiglaciecola sp. LCG003]